MPALGLYEESDTGGGSTGSQNGSETPSWYTSLSESESEQTIKEYEAKQLQIAKEQEERDAQEAPVRASEEAALKKRQQEETEAAARARIASYCLVPSLRGDTLKAARRAIAKTHCQLGKVRRPHSYKGTLLVTGQTPKRGKQLTAGATIAVTLTPQPPKQNHHS